MLRPHSASSAATPARVGALRVRPGSDSALALAMIHVLIEEQPANAKLDGVLPNGGSVPAASALGRSVKFDRDYIDVWRVSEIIDLNQSLLGECAGRRYRQIGRLAGTIGRRDRGFLRL
jgi:anaerobic selenocysteine-containing dehydrogenase